ncbi:MAG: hypothetical protein A4E47_00861 [Methanosaeta sp. PtaU1.Bin028]|nr:MAG: hypothetical protein A4E47_00861 [Methanosaeta sp. PtaU1.Bin028]
MACPFRQGIAGYGLSGIWKVSAPADHVSNLGKVHER